MNYRKKNELNLFTAFLLILWFIALIGSECLSAELDWTPMMGIRKTGSAPFPAGLGLEVNNQVPWGGRKQVRFKYGVGFWIDGHAKRKSGMFINHNLGVRVGEPVYIEAYVGPALTFPTDAYISSVFSINAEAGIGFVQDKWRMGVGIRHMSNAGMKGPNLGRDWFYLKIGVPL